MIRRPPRSTRTDTLFPYTTLFRSSTKNGGNRYADESFHFILLIRQRREELSRQPVRSQRGEPSRQWNRCAASCFHPELRQRKRPAAYYSAAEPPARRTEERRVGKEGVRTGRFRWSPAH